MTDDFRIGRDLEKLELRQLERDVELLQTKVESLPVLTEQIKNLAAATAELRDETKSTRHTLIGFCVSIALACIVGLIGILQVVPS